MAEEPRREVLGTLLRAMLAHLEAKGLLAKVKAAVPLETRLLFDAPPGPMRWVPAEHFDQTYAALEQVAGRAALVELGATMSRTAGGSFIAPVFRMALSLFGREPASVFANLDRFWTVATRGLSFAWTSDGARSGRVVATFGAPRPLPACIPVLEGNLSYGFELTDAKGKFELVEVSADGQRVTLRASW